MNFVNGDIKQQTAMRGVKLYELPKKLGMSESTFYRLMRTELNDDDRKRVLNAIKEIVTARLR